MAPNNIHFDITRANIEFVGAKAVDLVIETLLEIWKRRAAVTALKPTYEAPLLTHFTARIEPLA